MTGYSGAIGVGVHMAWTLPDGSTMRATMTNTGSAVGTPSSLPTWSGAALGHTAYLGVAGEPAIYGTGTTTITLSGITITDSGGNVFATVGFVAADAESTDKGDGSASSLSWTTAGTSWSQLQIMNSVTSGGPTPTCTLTGLGTSTAKCTAANTGDQAAYILGTTVTPSQSITMSYSTTALQGFAFAIDLSSLQVGKTISGRVTSTDQFTVEYTHHGTIMASATTSGTSTSAATAFNLGDPGDLYTMTDVAASGSLANYVSTYSCSNGTSGSGTVLPSGTGTSFGITTALDDQISCTFVNSGLMLTDAATSSTKNVVPLVSVTDTFVLSNTSSVAGTFKIGTPTVTAGSTVITPTGYTFGGTTYTTVASLQAALSAAGATAAGRSVSVGVVYTAPATAGTAIVLVFPTTITSGTSTSLIANGTETDTTAVQVTIVKSGTAQASPGGLIHYSLLVSNVSVASQNGTNVYDQLPAGVVIIGTPTCAVTSGAAVCGTITLSNSNTALTSGIGTFPAGSSLTYVIAASAAVVGTYVNTGYAIQPGPVSNTSNAVTTIVAISNGLNKTVQNITQGQVVGVVLNNANPGDVLQYGLSFTNTTGVSLSGMVFTDVIPTNLTFLSDAYGVLPTGITSCTMTAPAVGATGTVTWTFVGSLASGSSLSATYRSTVK